MKTAVALAACFLLAQIPLAAQTLVVGVGGGPARFSETPLASTQPTVGSEILTNGNFASGVTGWTVSPAGSWFAAGIQPVVFTGAGLNDATSGGTYSAPAFHLYNIVIDAAGTPDTFKWQVDSGSFTSGVAITGSAQTLSNGVTITFAATTGHTLNDAWAIAAAPTGLGVFSVNGGQISQATGSSGSVLVTFTVSAIGELNTGQTYGPDIEVYDDASFYFEAHSTGTYSFLMAAGDVNFYSDGDGNAISNVSAKPYSVPYTTPVPSFVSFTDGLNPNPLDFRYGLGIIAIGFQSAQNNTGSDVLAFGTSAAQNNTGDGVAALGNYAALSNTGGNVTALGDYAAQNNTGGNVIAIGYQSALTNTGIQATAVGNYAAQNNTGNNVTAVGDHAAQANTGSDVLALGDYAAYNKTAGDLDVFVGDGDVLSGSQKAIDNSVILGASTASGGQTAVNNSGGSQLTNIIAINGVATSSNQTVIGNSGTTTTSIFGAASISLGGSASMVVCWKSDGKTLGYATVAEITSGTCH